MFWKKKAIEVEENEQPIFGKSGWDLFPNVCGNCLEDKEGGWNSECQNCHTTQSMRIWATSVKFKGKDYVACDYDTCHMIVEKRGLAQWPPLYDESEFVQ